MNSEETDLKALMAEESARLADRLPGPLWSQGISCLRQEAEQATLPKIRSNAQGAVKGPALFLQQKLRKALKAGDYQSISVVGGVAANRVLRARLAALSASRGVRICMPPRGLEMDNGAMIAAAAWLAGGPEAAGGLRFGAAPIAACCRLRRPWLSAIHSGV